MHCAIPPAGLVGVLRANRYVIWALSTDWVCVYHHFFMLIPEGAKNSFLAILLSKLQSENKSEFFDVCCAFKYFSNPPANLY